MRPFEEKMSQISNQNVTDFMAKRQHLLTGAPGNIVKPGAVSDHDKYKPFTDWDDGYNYQKQLGHLELTPWNEMVKLPPERFITQTSMLEPSEFRPGGYKMYDAAIAIPASTLREPGILKLSSVIPVRKVITDNQARAVNLYWENVAKPQTASWGLRGGVLVRPAHPYLIDVMRHPLGRKFLEAAHMLAHLTGDLQTTDKWYSTGKPRIFKRFCSYLAEIVTAYVYDIPLDISDRHEGRPGRPDFEYYGIEIESSTTFGDGYMKVPWKGKSALPLDETLAVVSTSVFIQPPPTGLMEGTMKAESMDKWTCVPTIVAITGWETPDVIMHHTLASKKPDNRFYDVCYTLAPEDLMSPEEFWMYLRMARDKFGSPVEAVQRLSERRKNPSIMGHYMYVEEWFKSEQYMRLLMQTPPGLCTNCLCWNHDSERAGLNVPSKPKYREPKPGLIKTDAAWMAYNKNNALVVKKLINPAWLRADAAEYEDNLLARRIWRERKRNFKAKWVDLKNRKKFAELEAKMAETGQDSLTAKQMERYLILRAMYKK